jgi:hypothetical protein
LDNAGNEQMRTRTGVGLLVGAGLVGATLALFALSFLMPAQAQPSWFQPNQTGPAPSQTQAGRCANCGEVGPQYVKALVPALACPSVRNLIYFYQASMNLADTDVIDAFVSSHACKILHPGAIYHLTGAGSITSEILIGAAPMFVMTSAILGQ